MSAPCKHGILNDVAIRQLCTAPTHDEVYDQILKDWVLANRAPYPAILHDNSMTQKMRDEYNGWEVKRNMAVAEATSKFFDDWYPMIAPFERNLIRTIGPTDEEIKKIFQAEEVEQRVNLHHISREALMIRNEAPGYRQQKVISFGTTSYGYDVRLSPKEFKIFTPTNVTEIDPMNFDPECLISPPIKEDPVTGLKYVLMPAHSYALGHTMEYFHMPRDVLGICLGKSTYARGAVGINATPIEPGFEGTVVLELTNFAPVPVRIYLETGISQFIFFKGEQDCETSYGDRGGKYQGQTGLTLPRI